MSESNQQDEFQPFPTIRQMIDAADVGEHSHPLDSIVGTEWHTYYCDMVSPWVATRQVLTEFRDSAPSSAVRAYVQGIIDMRAEFALVSGVAF